MNLCFFVSDLHGKPDRYRKLFNAIESEKPPAVFLGGDLLPSSVAQRIDWKSSYPDFVNNFLVRELKQLKDKMGAAYPDVFLILGNDDGRFEEAAFLEAATNGIWEYIHNRHLQWREYAVYGYCRIPPSPFQLKDWERYDVSRYVDPGCVSPEDGFYTVPVTEDEKRYATIQEDLEKLTSDAGLENAIFLFHTPPYHTRLDRAALDGKMIDYVPLDVHVGSIAVKRFIERRQPLLTLHGHIHESARLTGYWKDKIGHTVAFNASHDGPELSLIRFSPEAPDKATRELI